MWMWINCIQLIFTMLSLKGMKRLGLVLGLIILMVPLLASAYTVKRGDTLYKIAVANHLSLASVVALNPQIKNINLIYPNEIINLSGTQPPVVVTPPPHVTPPPVVTPPPPVVVPPVLPPSTGSEIRYTAYTTGYAALDNTPRGSTQIDLGGHSGNAGGTGTYSDPITLAVGHSIINGNDIGDYPYGTKWYVPNLRKYFTAADSCGDGNTPQNGPCHTGYQGHVWLDLYVGASLANGVLSCEDSITDLHLVIQNPASNYSVVPGAVYDTGCKQYGDAVVTN